MKHSSILLLMVGFLACAPCYGAETEATEAPAKEGHSIVHKVAMYIPNRVLDLLDIVRLRVRFGPGLQVGARVTEMVSANVGGYDTAYVGLPGPRNRPKPKMPFGFEKTEATQVKDDDANEDTKLGPDYGPGEIGLGAQALFIGVDAGIDPYELLDFLAGFFFIDLKNDDL